MAMTIGYTFGDYTFQMHYGLLSGDGVVIDPRYEVEMPGFLEALKKAIDLYPLVGLSCHFEEYASSYASMDKRALNRHLSNWEDDDLKMLLEGSELKRTHAAFKDLDFSEADEAYTAALLAEVERREQKALLDESKRAKQLEREQKAYPGYVYLIQSPTGAYKIGRTKNPDDRMKTFGIQLPFEVQFVHLIETANMYKLERSLHKKFSSKRVNGEWFQLVPEDIEFIKGITS